MNTTLTEFRQNTKKYFDLALQDKVLIQRGGVVFELRAAGFSQIAEVNGILKEARVPQEGRYVLTPEGIVGPTKLKPKSMKFCKEGHPIPIGRDRCLGKGCQYA